VACPLLSRVVAHGPRILLLPLPPLLSFRLWRSSPAAMRFVGRPAPPICSQAGQLFFRLLSLVCGTWFSQFFNESRPRCHPRPTSPINHRLFLCCLVFARFFDSLIPRPARIFSRATILDLLFVPSVFFQRTPIPFPSIGRAQPDPVLRHSPVFSVLSTGAYPEDFPPFLRYICSLLL